MTPDVVEEWEEIAREKGLAFLLDHIGLDGLGNDVRDMRRALQQIAAIQPRCLETLRSNGIVFDDLTDHWQKVGFTIYTDLCEAETIARQALEAQ